MELDYNYNNLHFTHSNSFKNLSKSFLENIITSKNTQEHLIPNSQQSNYTLSRKTHHKSNHSESMKKAELEIIFNRNYNEDVEEDGGLLKRLETEVISDVDSC